MFDKNKNKHNFELKLDDGTMEKAKADGESGKRPITKSSSSSVQQSYTLAPMYTVAIRKEIGCIWYFYFFQFLSID